jgi:hypothetical protein
MASLDVEECPSEGGLTKSGMTRLSDDDSAVLVSANASSPCVNVLAGKIYRSMCSLTQATARP